jgi:DNA-binding transcriptional MerR regulator
MRTSDILKKLNIPRHKLYYLEQKGYIKPKRIPMGELEAREYSEEDFKKLELIWKYLQSGFKHKIALQKAMEELDSPKLSLQEQNQKTDLVPPSPNLTPGPKKSEFDLKR